MLLCPYPIDSDTQSLNLSTTQPTQPIQAPAARPAEEEDAVTEAEEEEDGYGGPYSRLGSRRPHDPANGGGYYDGDDGAPPPNFFDDDHHDGDYYGPPPGGGGAQHAHTPVAPARERAWRTGKEATPWSSGRKQKRGGPGGGQWARGEAGKGRRVKDGPLVNLLRRVRHGQEGEAARCVCYFICFFGWGGGGVLVVAAIAR